MGNDDKDQENEVDDAKAREIEEEKQKKLKENVNLNDKEKLNEKMKLNWNVKQKKRENQKEQKKEIQRQNEIEQEKEKENQDILLKIDVIEEQMKHEDSVGEDKDSEIARLTASFLVMMKLILIKKLMKIHSIYMVKQQQMKIVDE